MAAWPPAWARSSPSIPSPSRRQLAAELGASATLDPGAGDVVDEIRRLTGIGATHAIDTTAKGAVINQAIEALAPLGTLALVGIRVPDFAMDVQSVMSGGKTVRGVIEGDAAPREFIPRLVELHGQGRLPAREADPPIRLQGHRCRVRRCGERENSQARALT